MSMVPAFVFTRRWIVLLVIALVVAATCVRLGIWQLDRLEQRRALNSQIRSGLAATPVRLDDMDEPADVQDLAYRRVEATGTYDFAHEIVLFGRSQDGRPGHHLLTPLVLSEAAPNGAEAILVDRGWVPYELDTPPIERAAPPSGTVTATGFLLPTGGETDVVIDRGPGGRVLTVSDDEPSALGRHLDLELWPLPLQLRSQSPPQVGDLPVVAPEPQLSEGPHLSYAIQWFVFATIALVGYVVLVRREARDRALAAERVDPGHG